MEAAAQGDKSTLKQLLKGEEVDVDETNEVKQNGTTT